MKASSIVISILLFCAAAFCYPACKIEWQFDHLERNARKVITAAELQAWATNFLAGYTNSTSVDWWELGTNFPPQLRGLAPDLGPNVFIVVNEDTNWPPYIHLFWGSGFLNYHGIEVGPTNFTGRRAHRAWQPGVYSY